MFNQNGDLNLEKMELFVASLLELSRILMGYPQEWVYCMVLATPLSSRKRLNFVLLQKKYSSNGKNIDFEEYLRSLGI